VDGVIVERFVPHPERPHVLLMAEGPGIGAVISLAEQLRGQQDADWTPLVLLGSDTPFPFRPRPSLIVVAGIPEGTIACMPLLEGWGIASRLASRADLPGCFDGTVTELAQKWLRELSPVGLEPVEIFAAGPTPMLEVTAELAHRFALRCQVIRADLGPI
jgi:dihydroorotate dehydrogenase electron transfer subunit